MNTDKVRVVNGRRHFGIYRGGRWVQKGDKQPHKHHPLRKCVECLFKIGFGYSTILRLTGKNKGLLHKWTKGLAGSNLKRGAGAPGIYQRKFSRQKAAEAAIIDSYKRELRATLRPERSWSRLHIGRFRMAQYTMRLYNTDPIFKIKHRLRNSVRKALQKQRASKNRRTLELVGCSVADLHSHIQAQFIPGMHWRNWGTYWELDHVKPCASFDLRDELELCACFNYKNLKPILKITNRRKGSLYNGSRHRHNIPPPPHPPKDFL